MIYTLTKKIGPYQGTYVNGFITTCVLYDSNGNRFAWHEIENRKLSFPIGSQIKGIVIKSDNTIDYKNSKPELIDLFSQTNI